jgi:hypothetical protein
MGDVVTLAAKHGPMPWRIISPIPGTVIHLDPDLPDHGKHLFLEAGPQRELDWQSDTLKIKRDGAAAYVLLNPGRHNLSARDPSTGEIKRTFVIVLPE